MANAPFARFPAKMDSMTEIRTLVEGACATAGIDREGCLRILLVVEELFTNTVLHGYRGESESPVWVALALGESGLTLHYEDAAPSHNPFGDFRPTETAVLVAQQTVGGLGLKLIRSLAKDATYSREGERNVTRIIFSVPARH
jgi:anti-sigma regulatory factor (Ser/Thr protein kinase)